MLIKLSDINLNLEELRSSAGVSKSIIFIHGFSGSSNDWKFVPAKIKEGYNLYAVDLPGHGKSGSPEDIKAYRTSSLVNQLFSLLNFISGSEIILAGYSMGGRAALQLAVNFPGRLNGLILESASAGIAEDKARLERTEADEKLAHFIETHSIEEFADYWMGLDLFNTQKILGKEKLAAVKKAKLSNNKTGLANSLRGFGAGSMPPVFDSLKTIGIKTLLITGKLDVKFTGMNALMAALLLSADHKIITNAGHNVHLEQPDEFCGAVNAYIKKL